MASRLDQLTSELAAIFILRGGSSDVLWDAGGLARGEHGPRSRVILTRQRGSLLAAPGPDRAILGTPLPGGEAPASTQVFTREETIEFDLRAPDEEALDALFDRVIDTVWTYAGPNAFEGLRGDGTEYAWVNEDSGNADRWTSRSPAIRIFLRFRLRALPQPDALAVDVEQIDTTAGYTGTGATAPDAVEFSTP